MTHALLLEYYRMTHAKPKSWIPEAYASGYFFVGPQMSTADKVSALHDAYIGATHARSPPEPPRPHVAAASSSVPAPPSPNPSQCTAAPSIPAIAAGAASRSCVPAAGALQRARCGTACAQPAVRYVPGTGLGVNRTNTLYRFTEKKNCCEMVAVWSATCVSVCVGTGGDGEGGIGSRASNTCNGKLRSPCRYLAVVRAPPRVARPGAPVHNRTTRRRGRADAPGAPSAALRAARVGRTAGHAHA